MSAILLQNGKQAFSDANGQPLSGGSVYFYAPSTSTPKDTWQDSPQTTLNTNPVILNARGEAAIYGSGPYRQVLRDAAGNLIWDAFIPDLVGSLQGAITDIYAKSQVQVLNIAALRLLDKTIYSKAQTTGYTTSGDGGNGSYWLNTADTSSADNGGTIIVAADGGRWYLIHNGRIDVRQFGAVAGTDFLAQITAAVTAIYNYGGGEVWVYKTYNCSGTIPMMPMVAIRGPGSGQNARIQATTNSGVLFKTTRPTGYAPALCIGSKVNGLTLVGTGLTVGGTCFSLSNCQQCEVDGNEVALFEVGTYWNQFTTDLGAGLQQAFFNKVTRNLFKPCTRGHFFKGAANRNTIDTNSYASCTIGYEFGDPLNISETNTFMTENVEGCNSWAEWSGSVYSQTWVNLCIENPTSNGFICAVKDPGRQVFVNLSLIPLGNAAAIQYTNFGGAVPSLRLGTAASSGTNRLGVAINENLMLYSPVLYGPTQHASSVFTGTVAAGGRTTIAVTLAASQLNYYATAYALRTLGGCCLLAYAQNGQVGVDIINPTTAPITITAVEIAVTVAQSI